MIFIGLGANLGDARATLLRALQRLAHISGFRQEALSSFYISAPMGGPPQPDYVNAVLQAQYNGSALQLLHALQAVETESGRERGVKNGPRTLDLDILVFNDEVICYPELLVPHPRLAERAFVLLPLMELAPDLMLPGYKLSVAALWNNLSSSENAGQRIEKILC